MSDTAIFICGFLISMMVVIGTFLFTFIEFYRMGKESQKLRNERMLGIKEVSESTQAGVTGEKTIHVNLGNG